MDVYEAFIEEVEKLQISAEDSAVQVVGVLTRAVKRAQMRVDNPDPELCIGRIKTSETSWQLCARPFDSGIHQKNNPYGHSFRPAAKKIVDVSPSPVSPSAFVKEFHTAYGQPVRLTPTTDIPAEEKAMRLDLLEEELDEYRDAVHDDNLIEIADALGDLVYVAYGAALFYGIDLDAVIAEIQRSNMSKLGADGKPVLRPDGKVLKGPNYFEPDVKRVLGLD